MIGAVRHVAAGRIFRECADMRPLHLLAIASLMFSANRLIAEPSGPSTRPTPEVCRRLADAAESNLQHEILDKWFPAAFDEGGGFFQDYNVDWSRGDDESKGIVYESRLTWTAAEAAAQVSGEERDVSGAVAAWPGVPGPEDVGP